MNTPVLFTFCFWLSCIWMGVIVNSTRPSVPVQLGGGNSPQQGRIEIFYNGEWGTVCDDRFTAETCKVICRQLFQSSDAVCITQHGNNSCLRNDGSVYKTAIGRIWLDSIECDGPESRLDECRKSNYGDTDCDHHEDAGCICQQTVTTVTVQSTGYCDKARHRIVPIDSNNPAIGRVEIQDDDGQWGLVCDDYWDDVDATVFCDCLGYKRSHFFRALLSPNHTSNLPILYRSVHCKPQDTAATRNLWDCETIKADNNRRCDPRLEAAAVMCGPALAWLPPVIPDVEMSCDGQYLSGCLVHDPGDLSAADFSIRPDCSQAQIYENNQRNICFKVDMRHCAPSHTKVDASVKHYCYNLIHSKQGHGEGQEFKQLQTDLISARQMCCVVGKNATAIGSFLPQIEAPSVLYSNNSNGHNITMGCYRGDLPDGGSLAFPAPVRQGEPVACFVSARSWDPRLFLVASDCKFMTSADGSGREAYFIRDKCPTTNALDLVLYNRDHFNWGFKFNMPKFRAHNELYLACDVYLCDSEKEQKPYCDRSCNSSGVPRASRKRDVGNYEESERTDVSVGKGPFLFPDDSSPLTFIDPADQFVSGDQIASDFKKLRAEEYEEFLRSDGSNLCSSSIFIRAFICLSAVAAMFNLWKIITTINPF